MDPNNPGGGGDNAAGGGNIGGNNNNGRPNHPSHPSHPYGWNTGAGGMTHLSQMSYGGHAAMPPLNGASGASHATHPPQYTSHEQHPQFPLSAGFTHPQNMQPPQWNNPVQSTHASSQYNNNNVAHAAGTASASASSAGASASARRLSPMPFSSPTVPHLLGQSPGYSSGHTPSHTPANTPGYNNSRHSPTFPHPHGSAPGQTAGNGHAPMPSHSNYGMPFNGYEDAANAAADAIISAANSSNGGASAIGAAASLTSANNSTSTNIAGAFNTHIAGGSNGVGNAAMGRDGNGVFANGMPSARYHGGQVPTSGVPMGRGVVSGVGGIGSNNPNGPSEGRGMMPGVRSHLPSNIPHNQQRLSPVPQQQPSSSQINSQRTLGGHPSNSRQTQGTQPPPNTLPAASSSTINIANTKRSTPARSPHPGASLKDPPILAQTPVINLPPIEPEKPLPPFQKPSPQIAVHHHPDLPFLVTHWIANYAPSAEIDQPYAGKGKSMFAMEQSDSAVSVSAREKKILEAKNNEAVKRIRRAASDLAWAFETLGAFGPSANTSISSSKGTPPILTATSYADLSRKYATTVATSFTSSNNLSNQRITLLDSLVHASSSATVEVSRNVLENSVPWSLLEAAYEGSVPLSNESDVDSSGSNVATSVATSQTKRKKEKLAMTGVGRRVGDSTTGEDYQSLEWLVPSTSDTFGSAMRNPSLFGPKTKHDGVSISSAGEKMVLSLRSNRDAAANEAARESRQCIVLRSKAIDQRREIEDTMKKLTMAMKRAGMGGPTSASAVSVAPPADNNSEIDHRRVVAQLQNRMQELKLIHSKTNAEATEAKRKFELSYEQLTIQNRYQNPNQLNGKMSSTSLRSVLHGNPPRKNIGFGSMSHSPGCNNMIIPSILKSQYQGNHRACTYSQTQMSILKSRLSHAITISSHLIYPVYCLRFDRTGKYFVTGADDQIVKLFRLGVGPKEAGGVRGMHAFNYCANARGAVLVCTLRGHAGVVTDIDVSADNALLATASGDGDVRVWGLRDGCPIAILRGHKDGANMVSWSTMSPCRLVTCGEDGLARMWDVREAALKRYGVIIGDRSDYLLPNNKNIEGENDDQNNADDTNMETELEASLPSIPLPPQEGQQSANAQPRQGGSSLPASNAIGDAGNNLIIPPLPPGAGGIGFDGNVNRMGANNENNRANPGDFVANNFIDEGVTLLAQLQHGAYTNDSIQHGPSTRAQKKAVKVMCIARCPVGGHFATGSDDGQGRVWADDDDLRVERNDDKLREFKGNDNTVIPKIEPLFMRGKITARQQVFRGPSNAPSKERLLATLSGHNNAITDMKYSSAGDRILTASMKDGVLRVWSWGKENPINFDGSASNSTTSEFKSGCANFLNMSQLLIRLTPVSQVQSNVQSSKRKGSSSASNNGQAVHCDGVAWTCDDLKIVTSQSSPLKATGTDIIPGSHMIFVWDSRSGRCLMGILSSHSSLCSTLVPHPFLSSVVATAGSDGVVNVWDLEKGDCFYTHKNLLQHGPIEPATDRGKQSGYLDGQFSPDGSFLVLTDENGRVTIFDTMVPASKHIMASDHNSDNNQDISLVAPVWMKEQYFANDYYDLFYDSHGYCVERGSAQPPHLAPKGVRCAHDGVSYSEKVRSTYSKLEGALPLPEGNVRLERDEIRSRSAEVRMDGGILCRNVRKKATIMVESPGLHEGSNKTAIITADGKLVHSGSKELSASDFKIRGQDTAISRNSNNSTSTGRALSSRYQWRDFNDIPDDEEENEDSNDEDFQGGGRRLAAQGSDSEEDDSVSAADSTPQPRRRRQQGQRPRVRPRREFQSNTAEEQQQSQPLRVSSRRPARRQFDELDSDDEELVQMMSTHTTPSGAHCEDWTVSNHFFKMPRDSQLCRKWLCRTTYQGDCLGRKLYCPQVGDSVVYIPRAHYDTLQKFPICGYSAPWKSWPTHSTWPAVCCRVTHIRYRFPYEMYYRSRRREERLQSVAAILTLEIKGIPYHSSERDLPWPLPTFVSAVSTRTRSHDSKFEVTIFECDQEDFIIPEYLYTFRLQALESSINANKGSADGIEVTINFPPENDDKDYGMEDPFYKSFDGILTDTVDNYEEEFHFQNSGYNALALKWDTHGDSSSEGEDASLTCVWDVNATEFSEDFPTVPFMSEDVTRDVTAALDQVLKLDPLIREMFHDPVDTNTYTDYLDMIEVPMYLSLIKKRLKNNYYTNKDSVVADMELVKENCYKYNEDGDGYYALAGRMYEKFKSLVDSIPTPQNACEDSSLAGKTRGSSRHTRISTSDHVVPTGTSASQARRLSRVATRGSVGSAQPSAFENLPHPDSAGNHAYSTRSHDELHVDSQSKDLRASGRKSNRVHYANENDRKNDDRNIDSSDDNNMVASDNEDLPQTNSSLRLTHPAQRSAQAKPKQAPERNSTRSSSRIKSKPSYEDKNSDSSDDDDDDIVASDDDDEDPPQTKSNSRPTRRSTQRSAQTKPEHDTGRNSTRSSLRTASKPRYDDGNIDSSDDDNIGASDDEDQPKNKPSTRPTRRPTQKSAPKQEPERNSARSSSRTASKPSYAEKDSEEEDYQEDSHQSSEDDLEDSDDGFSSDEEIVNQRQKRRHTTDSEDETLDKISSPKRKRGRASDNMKAKGGYLYYPDVPKWPQISKRRIPDTVRTVLNELRSFDTETLFENPVYEDYPAIADDYLARVTDPMCFRTIEEVRMPSYKCITELQDDLILTFRNCCVFNGEKSPYYARAVEMWQGLNNVFINACNEHRIQLPARFRDE